MEVCLLYRIDFNNMENNNAEYTTDLGLFGPTDKLTARGNVGEYISNMKPVKMYTGWDGQVYPQFKIEKKHLK